jgi:hypothetical protein
MFCRNLMWRFGLPRRDPLLSQVVETSQELGRDVVSSQFLWYFPDDVVVYKPTRVQAMEKGPSKEHCSTMVPGMADWMLISEAESFRF